MLIISCEQLGGCKENGNKKFIYFKNQKRKIILKTRRQFKILGDLMKKQRLDNLTLTGLKRKRDKEKQRLDIKKSLCKLIAEQEVGVIVKSDKRWEILESHVRQHRRRKY